MGGGNIFALEHAAPVCLAGMFMPGLLQDQEKETRADDDNASSKSHDRCVT